MGLKYHLPRLQSPVCPPVNLVKLLLPILIERGGLPSVVCIDSSSSSCCSSSSISIQYITISVYHYILYTSNTVYHSALWYYAVSQMAWFPYTSFFLLKDIFLLILDPLYRPFFAILWYYLSWSFKFRFLPHQNSYKNATLRSIVRF